MVVHLGKLEPGLGMDAKNVPPAIDAPVPMSGRSSITTVPTNKQILLQLQMKFPQVPQKLLTSIIDSYVELQRPLHESWSNGLAGATTENSAQNGQFGSDGHHIQHPNPNRRRRENGTEGAATGCAHNIKADANPPKKRRRGRVDDSAGNQTANAGTRACVSAHLNKSYDERLLAQGHPPETGHDATQTNPNTQAIRFYATQDAPDRTAKEHQEYRALLNGCFEKASTRRVGTALKGGTCFNAFIELYTWSLGSTTGCDLDEGDTDQALQCDKTFEDEVLAAKRFLRQKYPSTCRVLYAGYISNS